MRSSTTSRPVLSSHYHQPAGLIGLAAQGNPSSATLQLGHASQQFATSGGGGGSKAAHGAPRHPHHPQFKPASSTLNRHQNRQLPPIPYSTMSMAKDQQHERQHQQQPVAGWQQAGKAAAASAGGVGAGNQRQAKAAAYAAAAASGQCGSQTPLIYGVIE